MRDPLATEGSISANPLHTELLEIAKMVNHEFILDVTLTRDRQISGVFAGNPVVAHAAGVRFLEEVCLEHTKEPADLVITCAAGFPLDLTFYQTIKAVTAAQHLVKEGGIVLVLSECAEGVGSKQFAATLRSMTSFKNFLDETATSPVAVDQWQLEKLAISGLRSEMFFYVPGVNEQEIGFLHSRAFRSLDDAIASATMGLRRGSNVLLVRDGPYAFARVGSLFRAEVQAPVIAKN